MAEARFEIAPYDFAAAARLEDAARRLAGDGAGPGPARASRTRQAARAFLAADVRHPLSAFGGLAAAAEVIWRHVQAGSRITVHGDYDVDGVCSTGDPRARAADARRARRLVPAVADRGRLRAGGCDDRAAGRSRDAAAGDRGLRDHVRRGGRAGARRRHEVVVTDHHAPRADGRLPDAPIGAPAARRWQPVRGPVCRRRRVQGRGRAAGAAGLDPALADEDLDLVALATVADVVPLLDENRALVRLGLGALRRTAQARAAGADGGRPGGSRARRRDGDRVPPRAADQRGGADRAGRRCARAPAHRGRGPRPGGRRGAGRRSTSGAATWRRGSCSQRRRRSGRRATHRRTCWSARTGTRA